MGYSKHLTGGFDYSREFQHGFTVVTLPATDFDDIDNAISAWGETLPYAGYRGFFRGIYSETDGISAKVFTRIHPTLKDAAKEWRTFRRNYIGNRQSHYGVLIQIDILYMLPSKEEPKAAPREKLRRDKAGRYRDKRGRFVSPPHKRQRRDKRGRFTK